VSVQISGGKPKRGARAGVATEAGEDGIRASPKEASRAPSASPLREERNRRCPDAEDGQSTVLDDAGSLDLDRTCLRAWWGGWRMTRKLLRLPSRSLSLWVGSRRLEV
jgi:hypothetical protein